MIDHHPDWLTLGHEVKRTVLLGVEVAMFVGRETATQCCIVAIQTPQDHLWNPALPQHVAHWRKCELSSDYGKIITSVTRVVARIVTPRFIWILLGMYHLLRGASVDLPHKTMSFEVPHQIRISQMGSGARGRAIGLHKTTAIPALSPIRAHLFGDGHPNGAGSSK